MVTTAQIRLGIDARPAQQGARQFTSEVDRLERELAQLDRRMGSTERELRGFGRESRRASDSMRDLVTEAKSFAGTAFGFAGIVAGLGRVATEARRAAEEFAEIDRAQRRLQATGRLGTGQSAALRAQAELLGASTPFSITQVVDAQQNLAQAGLSVQDILRAVEPSLRLASAAQIELGASSQIVIDALKSFRLESSEAARVVDVLVAASTRSSANVTQLGEALGEVGAISNQLGLDLEETVGLLGALANGGPTGRGSQGGTALRGVFASIVAPSQQVREQFAAAGLDVERLTKLLDIDARSALEQLANGVRTSSDLFTVFGRESATAAATILENRDAADALTRSLRAANGEAQRFGELVQGGPAGTIDRLRSAREARNAALGELVTPITDSFNEAAIEFVQRQADVFRRLQGNGQTSQGLLRTTPLDQLPPFPIPAETREATRATEELNAAQSASDEITRRVTEATRGLTDAREALRQAGLTEGLEDDVRTSLGLVNELSRAVSELRTIAQEGGDAARIATPQFLARRGELAIARGAQQSILDQFTRPTPQPATTEPDPIASGSASSPSDDRGRLFVQRLEEEARLAQISNPLLRDRERVLNDLAETVGRNSQEFAELSPRVSDAFDRIAEASDLERARQQWQQLAEAGIGSAVQALRDYATGAATASEATRRLLADIGQFTAQFALQQGLTAAFNGFNRTPASTSANGNVFLDGSVVPFASGGVISGRTLFPMGLAGEAGRPEGIFPLTRTPDGQLALQGAGGGGALTQEQFEESLRRVLRRQSLSTDRERDTMRYSPQQQAQDSRRSLRGR
jgi:TP901 family phage tail tape measure protein